MSIEIRIHSDGPPQCDLGVIENGEASPAHGLKHLMLTTRDYIDSLLTNGPDQRDSGVTNSATTQGTRLFAHVDYDGARTTWKLFDAHFEDGKGPDGLLLGCWPD